MIDLLARRSTGTWSLPRRAAAGAGGAVVLAVIVTEGLDTGFWPTGVATVVSGVLAVAGLVVPARWLWRAGTAAVVLSCALSVLTMRLSQRPEHIPGLVEMGALLLLMPRAVRHLGVVRAPVLAAGAWLTAPLVLLRLPGYEYGKVSAYGVPFFALAGVSMVLLGLYVRLLDGAREREREHHLQAQRLEYARELHDFVGHHITAVAAQTKALRFLAATGQPPGARQLDAALARIESAGAEALGAMRAMVGVMRRHQGPPVRPVHGLDDLRTLVATAAGAGPAVTLTVDPTLAVDPPPDHVGAVVHRVVQESLTNVRKHAAGATAVSVDVRRTGGSAPGVAVCVSDDAPGARRRPAPAGHRGVGLTGLGERVAALGGKLQAGPRPGPGWQLHAEIPLAAVAPPGPG
ncbi:sensor histidine kinase [Streptomyces sp. AN091965]|uniref:sensor histidine kinase n=1 Tax=Streptomyces sp. AN091965 TaxID=2927803 RepID=UPI001F6111C0|nr:histidine kinase [Streptomyces sp. AN091965]MCI3927743.1 histidine kinase [Streptomyces sp. AN091965]